MARLYECPGGDESPDVQQDILRQGFRWSHPFDLLRRAAVFQLLEQFDFNYFLGDS
jgi:hypothetical protein